MTSSASAEEWGLLSVGDLLENHEQVNAPLSTTPMYPAGELFFPFAVPCCSQVAETYARTLMNAIKSEHMKHFPPIEEVYRTRSCRLKQSLEAFRHIRERLLTTVESLRLSIPTHSTHRKNPFDIIPLLGMALGNDQNEYYKAVLFGISQIDWELTSASSCLEVFDTFVFDEEKCSDEIRAEMFQSKLYLALKSVRLCALLKTLLASGSMETKIVFRPPAMYRDVTYTDASLASFLTRICMLSGSLEKAQINCFPQDVSTTYVTCGGRITTFDVVGLMGTRLRKSKEVIALLDSGETILSCSGELILTVQHLAHHHSEWRYQLKEVNTGSSAVRKSMIVLDMKELGVPVSRCVFSCSEKTVSVLSSSESQNISKCRLFVSCFSLDDAFGQQGGEYRVSVRPESSTLLRDPAGSNTLKALHFTPNLQLSLGRVTLKERFHPFCIELWVYPRNVTEAQVVMAVGDKSSDEILLEIEPSGDGVLWRGGARTPQLGSSFTSFNSPGKLSSSERWWHVGLNFTGTSWELWLDNRFVSSQPALVSPEAIRNAACTIGKSFVGFLAEVRVWSHTRGAAELLRDSCRPLRGDEDGLCGYYPLNEQQGDLIADHSRTGQHYLASHHQLSWCACPSFPVSQPPSKRIIADFVPLIQKEPGENLLFTSSPHFFTVAAHTKGSAMCIYRYSKTDMVLTLQSRIELDGHFTLKGVSHNPSKQSIVCYGISGDRRNQLILWDVHEQGAFSLATLKGEYHTAWGCGRDVLMQGATFAKLFLSSEKFLVDETSWSISLSPLVVDPHPQVISSLLRLAQKAMQAEDDEFVEALCFLLHANLMFRYENNSAELVSDVGIVFSGAAGLLAVPEAAQQPEGDQSLRDGLVRLAFSSVADSSGLLAMCCRCFLSEQSRVAFVRSVAGKARHDREERLMTCLLNYYGGLRTSSEALLKPELAQQLYHALLLEATYQVDRSLRSNEFAPLHRTSRCLEVFQEVLFAKTAEGAHSTDLANLGIVYCKTLLRASEKTIDAVVKALRKRPDTETTLIRCLELSHVGALLPSFTVSLSILPTIILSTCSPTIQSCRGSLSALTEVMKEKSKWVSDLGIALTYSLCTIGCSLLNASPPEDHESSIDTKFLFIMRSGLRKTGTERDVAIKNLEQGVGSISKIFEDLQKADHTALRVVRDEQLKKMERHVMSAFCALMIPTRDLKEATTASLQPAFRHVLRMRPWILSKRQESKDHVAQVEKRARFVSQFEACCVAASTEVSSTAPGGKTHKPGRESSSQAKWRKLFKGWKAMRVLKTLMSSQEESDESRIGGDIIEFLQSDIDCSVMESVVAWRAQKARYRLSGLLLLKQLVEEARVSVPLARIILPVMAKSLYGWHYSDGVDCCTSEDLFRLQGAYFQLMDVAVAKHLEEKEVYRRPWAGLLVSLVLAEMRPSDFRVVRSDVCRALRAVWKSDGLRATRKRVNGLIPPSLRGTKLAVGLAAPSMVVGDSGLTIKSAGRGTCVAPCTWQSTKKQYSYYFEVYIVDLLPGGVCSIGVGPMDYSLSRIPGWDANSFGLQSDDGILFSGSTTGRITGFSFGSGDVVGCGWSVVKKEIYWTKNGKLLVSTEANNEAFSPLIGIDGKGIVQVNFGESWFSYNDFSEATRKDPGSVSTDAWDAFRIFSLRATLSLCEASEKSQASADSLSKLAQCVGHCFATLSTDILESFQCMEEDGSAYLKALLSHCTTLAQLLADTPKKEIVSHIKCLASAMEKVTTEAMRRLGPLESELVTHMLTTWYYTMNMVPPDAVAKEETKSSSTSHVFLRVLIKLGSRLSVTSRSSTSSGGGGSASGPACNAAVSDEVCSMSLALLQQMNRSEGASIATSDSSADKKKTVPPHSWRGVLHEWMVATLRRANRPTREVLLALAVLGGGARLAVPGDKVGVRRSKHTVHKCTFVRCSLSEEVCEVVEDGTQRVIPLRLVDLIIDDDEGGYFPSPECSLHTVQAKEVLSLADRIVEGNSATLASNAATPEMLSFLAQFLSILLRCTKRKTLQLPKNLATVLSRFCDPVDQSVPEMLHLRMDKVVSECCAAAMTSNTTQPRLSSVMASKGGSGGDDAAEEGLDGPAHSTMAPSLYMSTRATPPFLNGIDVMGEEDEESDMDDDDEEGADSEVGNVDYADYADQSASGTLSDDDSDRDAYTPTDGVDESFDSIHFDNGYLRIVSNRGVGLNYTLDMYVRLLDIARGQILFAQGLASNARTLFLVAKVANGTLYFGVSEATDGEQQVVSLPLLDCCQCTIPAEDVGRWVRLSFVQSGATLSLFYAGTLQESKKMTCSVVPLLQEEFFLAGTPLDHDATLGGDIKGLHLYEIALRPNMVEQLHSLNSSLYAFVEAHLCFFLRARRDGFDNYSRSPAAILVDILAEGNVGYLESSCVAQTREVEACAPEIDFSNGPDDVHDLFSMDTSTVQDPSASYTALWKKKSELNIEQLLGVYARTCRMLACFYSVNILAESLFQAEQGAEWLLNESAAKEAVKRILQFTVNSNDDTLYQLAEKMLRKAAKVSTSTTAGQQHRPSRKNGEDVLTNEALRCLLSVAQREQRTRVFESAHPTKATTAKTIHEVHIPGQGYFEFYFDPRCLTSSMLMTFASDQNLNNVLAQAPGFALASFTVRLRRIYFDIRSDTTTPQWGYKVYVVFDNQPQVRAMRLFWTTMSMALESNRLHRFPFLLSNECLSQLGNCAAVNTSKTRRIALRCCASLFMYADLFRVKLPLFPGIHDIRRLAERQYRKRVGGGQQQVIHSRFVQTVSEAYMAYRDAMQCWDLAEADADGATPVSSMQARQEFVEQRMEQRAMYRLRDAGAERIVVQKMPDSPQFRLEWSPERLFVARNEGGAASLIVQTPLTTGKWYYEIHIRGLGNSFVGVVPSYISDGESGASPNMEPFAFNGKTGLLQGPEEQQRKVTTREVWGYKDYVGVVLDLDQNVCTFIVNGQDSGTRFNFGVDAGKAASAAAGRSPTGGIDKGDVCYYPFLSLERGETLFVNFGGATFEYDPPRGCLPLDPANLSIGSALPYNQMRAFQDLSAHLLTSGKHPLPPFYYEEADPFAESKERSGPAHVSIHAEDNVVVNLLDVKNIGTEFKTITADCSVRDGCWYYEATLKSQGLMQIGWALRSHLCRSSVGDNAASWSVDLFRRVKWHNGKPEAVAMPRRWSVGDVVGCALDLPRREMTFFLNGRPISSGGTLTTWTFQDLPLGSSADYVPAVSLRSGNQLSFNFGSSGFKYKPEGFNALGVSDSWGERMDTFYANERLSSTHMRLQVLRDIWLKLGGAGSSTEPASSLYPFRLIVRAVDLYCKETSKNYSQITEEDLAKFLKAENEHLDAGFLKTFWEHFNVLTALARVAQVCLPFLDINTHHLNMMTKLLLAIRTVLFRQLRVAMVGNLIKESNGRIEHFRISINRMKARRDRKSLKSSIFGQTFATIADQHPRLFQTSKRFWSTVFLGEGAEDVGGPYREHINEMCRELMSTDLPLFVPTANHTHNTGTFRDAYVPAASASTPQDLAAFTFLGQLMGGAMRSEEPLSLFFPQLVWRYLSGYPLEEADLDGVDHICLQCVNEFRQLSQQADSKEAFGDVFDSEYFVTKLSDHSSRELIPGGSQVLVTYDRCAEYAEALLHTRLHEFDLQLKSIRDGMLQVIPELALLLLTPEELELRVCGQADFKVEELRKNAIFEGLTSEDKRVQFLWQALEEATPAQRRLFLRFVSGRDRLPIKLRVLPLSTQGDADSVLPRAATCFYAIELPDYSTIEVMRHKLYYSIENCMDMDTDFNARPMDEMEGPHLLVGMDDGRPDEIVHPSSEE